MKEINPLQLCAATLAIMLRVAAAQAEMVVLEPIKDTTLFESAEGDLGNGTGLHLFVGRTGQADGESIRRALIAFDIAGNIPPGASVDSVTLQLHLSRTPVEAGTQMVSLHTLVADWGEANSTVGGGEGSGVSAEPAEATWLHTFFDTEFWTEPGGDFATAPSASQEVADIGAYTWGPTPEMRTDVQEWVDQPEANFGWALIGNEARSRTVKRFDSQDPTSVRPALIIEFTIASATRSPTAMPTPTASPRPGMCVGDCNGDDRVAINELIIGVNVTLGFAVVDDCLSFDINADRQVTINELVTGVDSALNGCVG